MEIGLEAGNERKVAGVRVSKEDRADKEERAGKESHCARCDSQRFLGRNCWARCCCCSVALHVLKS